MALSKMLCKGDKAIYRQRLKLAAKRDTILIAEVVHLQTEQRLIVRQTR